MFAAVIGAGDFLHDICFVFCFFRLLRIALCEGRSTMWVALWVLLVASSAYDSYGSKTYAESATIPRVVCLTGGATTSNGQGDKGSNDPTTAAPLSHARCCSSPPCSVSRMRNNNNNNRIAWSLPWFIRRRTRRRKSPSSAAGRAKLPAPGAGDTVPSAALSGALAYFVGAVLATGGTLGVWPHMAEASPFDPRPPPNPSKQPFFEGWFIR